MRNRGRATPMRLLPRSIRGELLLLAAVIAVPLLAMLGYGLYDRARDEIAQAEAVSRRVAENSADRVADYVTEMRVTLESVAKRPLVRAMDAARCDPRLADMVDLYPRVSSFITVNREGVILCSSRPLPRDRVIRIVDEDLLRDMLARPRLLASKPIVSRVTGRWIVSVVQPVTDEGGALVGTVSVATELAHWQPFPPPEALPAGALISVVTADGTIIAQSQEAEKWISKRIWDEGLLRRALQAREGVTRAKGPFGVDRIYGLKPVAGLPWMVLAGIAEDRVLGPARERLLQVLVLVVIALAIVFALAWGTALRLVEPVAKIADAARVHAEGDKQVRLPVAGPRELAQVAAEFNRMVEIVQREEARLRDLNELSSDFSWETDAEHRFTQLVYGKRFPPLLADNAVIGKARWELPSVAPDEEGWKLHRETVEAGREFRDFRFARRGADGQVRHFEVSGKPLFADGRFVGYRGTGVDVSERVLAQEQLAQLNRELEDRVRERTAQLEGAVGELEAFSYSVSHDLRAPVRHIDGFLKLLEQESPPANERAAGYLAKIGDSSRRMTALIEDLLELARSTRDPLQIGEVALGPLVDEVLRSLEPDCAGRRIEWRIAPLPGVLGDRALLRVLLENLLSNAVKYTRARDVARIEVGTERLEDGETAVLVRDNGVGFDMRYREKLFGAFQRLHSEEEFEGTGIGLATARRVAIRHDARIWAEGEPGRGATFRFTVRLAGGRA